MKWTTKFCHAKVDAAIANNDMRQQMILMGMQMVACPVKAKGI